MEENDILLDEKIKRNLETIKNNIKAACVRSKRNESDVTLIAVSKTKPINMINAAIKAGTNIFGENRVQELVQKIEQFPNADWHMIGHLQTNKVKYIIDKVSLIHSVESASLVNEIQKEAAKKNIISNILIEINIAGETSKFGIKPEETYDFVKYISKNCPNIKVKGLMTVAPFTDNPEESRIYFRHMYDLLVDIRTKNYDNIDMNILSMGMTNDYEVAVEEGATHVRVGTGIFGTR